MFGAARPGPLVRGFAQLRVIKFLTLNHLSPMLSKHPGFDGPSIHVAPRLSASLQFWTVLGISQDSRVHAHGNRTKGALQDFIIPFPLVVLDLRNNIKVAQICLLFLKGDLGSNHKIQCSIQCLQNRCGIHRRNAYLGVLRDPVHVDFYQCISAEKGRDITGGRIWGKITNGQLKEVLLEPWTE